MKWVRAKDCNIGECVEVALLNDRGLVAVRDSNAEEGDYLIFMPEEWATFLAGAKAGDFDNLV